ncbi:MAG: hypothetical protein ABEK50_19100, partial [bacterium]
MVKAGIKHSFPVVVVTLQALVLWNSGWMFESGTISIGVFTERIVRWAPLVMLGASCLVTVYFNSSRLTHLGIFLLLTYLYVTASHWPYLRQWFGPTPSAYRNSFLWIPVLIPTVFILVHSLAREELFTAQSIYFQCLILATYPVLFFLHLQFPMNSLFLYDLLPRYKIPVGMDTPWSLTPILLLMLLGFALLLNRERNFYSNDLSTIFWIAVACVIPFFPGLAWTTRIGVEFQFPVGFSVAGVLFIAKAMNFAWSKAYRDPLTQVRARMALDENLESLV